MKPSSLLRSRPAFLFLLAASLTALSAATADRRPPAEPATSAALGGRDRYLAHVSTDKPIYRPREKVYVRSVILNAADHIPLAQAAPALVEILGPKGNTVSAGRAQTEDSVTGFAWDIPDGQPGGEYTVRVSYPELGVPPAERRFDVRAYRAPRLKTQITFFRDGYGPGDTVSAAIEATRAEGGAPSAARVTVTARIDGTEVNHSTTTIDSRGRATALFALPAEIERGDGTLTFAIEDGGVTESASKTIPILLQTVDLAISPEGGDLVAGLPCRVYVEARTPFRKPADIAGIVIDGDGAQVGAFRTEHEGRGLFTFEPRAGLRYSLKILEPSGIRKTFPLPEVQPTGTVITAAEPIYRAGQPVVVRVNTSEKGPLTVTLAKREQQLSSLTISGADGTGQTASASITFTPPASADGVLIATVWNADRVPVAERLIYREPARRLVVRVEADRKRYVPGGKAALTVTATDDRGEPVEAVVGLTVTDDSVLELIEKREQAPRLPVMVLLESDVRELADAHVYLDPENPKAPADVDLLLGTQGWRRFAFVRVSDFIREDADSARRVLALRLASPQEQEESKLMRFKGDAGAALGLEKRMAAGDEVVLAEGVVEEPPADRADAPDNKPASAAGPQPVVALPVDALREGEEKERRNRQIAAAQPVAAGAMKSSARQERYILVREYHHAARPDRQPGDRRDFTETLYWHAGVRTDAKTGKAEVAFDLNDSVTSFRVFADAFAQSGALGSGQAVVESVQPFYIEPKLPLEVTMGDRILLPIAAVNGTDGALTGARMAITPIKGMDIAALDAFDIGRDARVRRLVALGIGDVLGDLPFALTASAGGYADTVTRTLRVVPRGFPVEIGQGGMLAPDGTVRVALRIPATRVPGSVKAAVTVYPTPLANLTEALERLIQEPNGCFEQTSSTTYPLVMAQQYFTSHQGVDPKLVERSRELLARGYDRLIGFECKERGYEWFAADPGHEALTAYGLLEFIDMAKVQQVDPKMLERTRDWLLAARDGKGGFKRERRALHTWIEDRDCSNAYITWALLTAGEKPESLAREIETVKAAAAASKNSYVMALGANVARMTGDAAAADALCAKLAALQVKDGHVDGATTSIVGSGGEALQIETTALAILAWLPAPACAGNVETGMQWLADVCKAGRFGSTQSTVLALRAILAYDAARSTPKAPGTLQLVVDGRNAGSAVAFDKDTQGAIKLTDIAELLEPGEHAVEIRMTGGSAMPCSVAVTYANDKPDNSAACKVAIAVTLADAKVAEGAVTEARVTVTNRQEDEVVPTPIAIIGIPGGLEVRHDQLKELVKAGRIAAYEVLGREVVLYWRSLKAAEKVEIPISLVAAIPGTYTAPASRAYLYYTDEHKQWAAPLTVKIGD